MTFSIVARSADGAAWGVAVASKFLAVGAAVPAGEPGAGAVATQAHANLAYKAQALELLRTGTEAQAVLDALVAGDDGRATRQVGVVDVEGRSASYTGGECHDWAGGRAGPGYAVQGNILTGEDVLDAMQRAWLEAGPDTSFPARLLAALAAGDAAGGDRRGRQSASLLVVRRAGGYGGSSDVEVDLRVDDAPDPVRELGRLLRLHELYFGRPDPATLLPLEGALAQEVQALVEALGHPSLESWAGVENYEERLVEGSIDPLVLERLRAAGS
ncbi:MAG: DUF1028 domain-containing protein [Actinomycetota bacterium]|nr:DUF1028 domain-containing protein [Actinomycetota bacterium]